MRIYAIFFSKEQEVVQRFPQTILWSGEVDRYPPGLV